MTQLKQIYWLELLHIIDTECLHTVFEIQRDIQNVNSEKIYNVLFTSLHQHPLPLKKSTKII